MRVSFIIAVLLANVCGASERATPSAVKPSADQESKLWPTQAMPKAFVRTPSRNDFPAPRASFEMMIQSVVGLPAKAVNDGRGDEMVWVGSGNIDVEDWLARLLKRHPQVELRGIFDPWTLVDRFAKRGIIKGYILYRADASKGQINEHRRGMDCSVNVATSLAGILDGVTPLTWCAARLPCNIRTVSPEELIWRIRMKHDPEQTRKQIELWSR